MKIRYSYRTNWYRRPRTMQEARANGKRKVYIDGYIIRIRPKRQKHRLPGIWDLRRQDQRNRSWKRHRRKQWKILP